MARKVKVWRVRPEYDGRVSIESEKKRVLLSGKLSQAKLIELSKIPLALGFLEKITITANPNEG